MAPGNAKPLRASPGLPGFWVPDEVVERVPEMGEKALYAFCVLGLCDSLDEYPSAGTLASVLGVPEEAVWDTLQLLYDAGAINDHDVQAVYVATSQSGRNVTDEDEDEHDADGGREA